jgi:hypothetical protein
LEAQAGPVHVEQSSAACAITLYDGIAISSVIMKNAGFMIIPQFIACMVISREHRGSIEPHKAPRDCECVE